MISDRITGVRNGITTTNNLIVNGEVVTDEIFAQKIRQMIDDAISG